MFCLALSSVPIGHTEFPVFPSIFLNTIGLKITPRKKLFLLRLVISIVAGINSFIATSEGQQLPLQECKCVSKEG